METRRVEDRFEECLSAYLEGRRSIEESLSLYPALASELEPLLRTAVEVARGLQDYQLPTDFQEQLRQRLLMAARRRRASRRLAGDRPRWWGWDWRRWGLVAVGASAAAVALVLATLAMQGGGGDDQRVTGPSSPTPMVADISSQLQRAHENLERLKQLLQQSQTLEPDVIVDLSAATARIASSLDDLDEEQKGQVEALVKEQWDVLNSLPPEKVPPEAADEVEATKEHTKQIASDLGIPLTTPAPTPEVTPEPTQPPPTATPEPTPAPTEPPAPTSTPAPAPTEEPNRGIGEGPSLPLQP